MRSSLRAPFLKALLVGGALSASVAFAQDEASAEPVVSSWYGPGLEGNLTASGEVFDPYSEYTAASLYYPMGTVLEVCYVDCTVVRVNDLGPYVAGRDLDLSQVAAEDIGLTYVGTDAVEVQVLGYDDPYYPAY
jgi:rare lipoprotein A